ncbi:MAG TPA: PAC2 family protein [Thermoleophilaceae bacterium]|nr:PAC2 family protein [Thermoleophilaceae bacterium]
MATLTYDIVNPLPDAPSLLVRVDTVIVMQDVIWRERPNLRAPVMVCSFKGWNDAGEAASAALTFIQSHFDCAAVAEIDPEEFYDFSAVRPTVRLTEGLTREIDWPSNALSAAAVPGADGDLVMLQGTEPSLRWRRFTDNIVSTARELDVRMVITLGALLADVPHSRPVSISGLASDQALVQRLGFGHTSYEGPTGIVGVLHHSCAQAGLPSVSLWASVPHYVAAAPNPKVALALVRAFEGAAGVAVDAGELEEAAEDYERQVSAAVASDPAVQAIVERLESAMDEVEDGVTPEESIPSAVTIARDFQRFLRQRGPNEPGQDTP